jgi:hypothetical protein
MLKSLSATTILLMLAAAPIAAHEGHAHRYMGTIAAVTAQQVELKTTAGKTMVFKLDDTTRITRGPEKASKDDLKVGVRAVVEADEGSQPATAKSIKLPSAASSKTS